MKKALALPIALALLLPPVAEARRRVLRVGAGDDPATWLAASAFVLTTTEHPASPTDLEPLRTIARDASIVALGDGTHGTHEFHTVKLRMIEFLAREMAFDVVAFEIPLPVADRLEQYVGGGAGDLRILLADLHDRLGYRFWDVEEMVQAIEWLREYNRHADRPIHVAGVDVFDGVGAATSVLAYLWSTDPIAAADAQRDYGCIHAVPSTACAMTAKAIHDNLLAKRDALAATNRTAYEDALQHARIVVQSQSGIFVRDENMAINTRWVQAQRSRTGRIILWAHGEHIGKTLTEYTPSDTAGMYLDRSHGRGYVAIGMLTGRGTFRQWEPRPVPAKAATMVSTVPAPASDSYEARFALGPGPIMIIPLTGALPAWLSERAPYFTAGTSPVPFQTTESLPDKFDAVVYIAETRETTLLRP